jgi:hypothetical protein
MQSLSLEVGFTGTQPITFLSSVVRISPKGETAFTVPLFDEFKRNNTGNDWKR